MVKKKIGKVNDKALEKSKKNILRIEKKIKIGGYFICFLIIGLSIISCLVVDIFGKMDFVELAKNEGYVEVCEYETVEKYYIWTPLTEEECHDEYYLSYVNWYLCEYDDCMEETKMKPEVRYYNESVCMNKTLVNYEVEWDGRWKIRKMG